jgi:hypothetical protein
MLTNFYFVDVLNDFTMSQQYIEQNIGKVRQLVELFRKQLQFVNYFTFVAHILMDTNLYQRFPVLKLIDRRREAAKKPINYQEYGIDLMKLQKLSPDKSEVKKALLSPDGSFSHQFMIIDNNILNTIYEIYLVAVVHDIMLQSCDRNGVLDSEKVAGQMRQGHAEIVNLCFDPKARESVKEIYTSELVAKIKEKKLKQ